MIIKAVRISNFRRMAWPVRFGSVVLFLTISASYLAHAAERTIDANESRLRVHVGKSGLFSAAGHEHWITASIAQGSLDEHEPAHIWFRIEARKLTVEPDKDLSPAQQADVQTTMQTQVLDSARYPEINFHSTSVEHSGDGWLVKGELQLRGHTREVSVVVHQLNGAYSGRCEIKQTDFGIRPVAVAGGMVKVKNELEIEFSIATRNHRQPSGN